MTYAEKYDLEVLRLGEKEGWVPFHKKNVNPHGVITGDCSCRALATASGKPYYEILDMQVQVAKEFGYYPSCKENTEEVLKRLGFVKHKQPRKPNGDKYKVGEIGELVGDKTAFITLANHNTAYVGGEIVDLWNCSKKSIGNYYTRG